MPFTRYINNNQRFAILAAALLLLGACTQKMETRELAPNAASPTQASSPAGVEKLQSGQTGRPYDSLAAPSAPAGSVATESQRRAQESVTLGGAALSRYPHPTPPHFPRPPVIPRGVERFPDKEPTSVLSAAEHPWSAENQLLHIAIRGYDLARADRPRANVVLLIDTSGSMQPSDRLPLLQQGFRLFAQQLRDDDRIAIVTYAGQAQTALDPTAGRDKEKILDVIDNLRASGSTAGGDGLRRAYALAERHFDKQAVNRVILATDGDFNVGITDPKELERFIVTKRKTGIYLSILGVGVGNLNDALMQRLAQAGNGNAAYIDSLLEARKAMSEELASTMFPIADDVKIQVEFNPARVVEYRLIGYETRMLRREDFNDDKVDAGDIGAGHTVTALYEITPVGAKQRQLDPLRYQTERDRTPPATTARTDEMAFVKLRYKLPGETSSRLIEQPVRSADGLAKIDAAPVEQRFAIAVAAFGQRLRGESAVDNFAYGKIADLANAARGADPEGYRAEFVRLVRMAETLGAVAQR